MLMSGDTWYGKFGFIPEEHNDIDKYNKNKEIYKKLKLKDIKFEEIIHDEIKDDLLLLCNMALYINNDMLLGYFLEYLFNNKCKIFLLIYHKIYYKYYLTLSSDLYVLNL
jgi:hypothetical protein